MSNVDPAEFNYWEFVACSRCQLPFASDSGSNVPFWLTECGHVICNSHLNADQSCAQCGSAGIQLVPLQPQMEAPMSDWFRSIPHALDAVAYAAKFQQETMAYQIRYYKSRQQQHKTLIDRLKRDVSELRRTNEMLSHENAQFREQLGYQPHSDGGGPADFVNSNGKRPMLGSDRYRPATSSSHSNHTPQGPDRLTLPPGQQPPSLSSNRPRAVPSHERPGSSRFKDKYAYAAPPAQHHTQPLSYAQAAPRRAKQNIDSQSAPQVQPRFKPAQSAAPSDNNARSKPPLTQMQNQPFAPKARNMGPPPTPQITNRGQVPMSARRGNANNRSLPPAQRFAPPMADQQRFAPATASGAPQRFSLDGTSTSHGHGGSMRGAQRAPFVPGGFG